MGCYCWKKSTMALCLLVLLWAAVASAGENFVDNQDGTISDAKQGLLWQKTDDGVQRSWKEAVSYCEALEFAGHSDWVLPESHQLETLIDTNHSPTIDPLFSVKPSYYWSSTGSATSASSAKYVNFFYGNTYSYSKDNPYYVLCVREGTAGTKKGLSAVFTGAPVSGKALSIRFAATVTGGREPYFYEWEFGDGGTSGASGPTHAFAKEGQYKVVLTVSDDEGAIIVAYQEITLPLIDIAAPSPAPDEQAAKAQPKEKTKGEAGDGGAGEKGRGGVVPPVAMGQSAKNTGSAAADPSKTGRQLRGMMDVAASGQAPPYKGGALGHGLLAYTFANGMAGDGDWNKDGTVSASELQGYLDQAIKSLSKGQQTPVITRDDEDFAVCAPNGSTYVFAIATARDDNGTPLAAGQDAELVRKAVEDKCRNTKTMMLTGDHANRQEIFQALLMIGSMVTTEDTLVIYIGGVNSQDNGRLNWHVNDTMKELPVFTGIFHDDLLSFMNSLPIGHILVLGEKN